MTRYPSNLARVARRHFPRLHSQLLIRKLVREALESGEPELHLLPRFCTRRSVVVDVGANCGIYSFVAVRCGATVVAIEPNPALASFIRTWAGARVTAIEAAASDRRGVAKLAIPVAGDTELSGLASLGGLRPRQATSVRHLETRTLRLDDLGVSNVRLIKIDVEGHEPEVLSGAANLLAEQRPVLLVEAEERHRPGAVATTRQFLLELGYRGFFLSGERFHPIEQFSVAKLQNAASVRDDGTVVGEYVNNFLYVPEDEIARYGTLLVPG